MARERGKVFNTFQVTLWKKDYENQFNYCFPDFALFYLSIIEAQNFITKTIFTLLYYTETGVGLIYVNFLIFLNIL